MLPRSDARACAVVLDTRLSSMPGVIASRELLWLAKRIASPYHWVATPEGWTTSSFSGMYAVLSMFCVTHGLVGEIARERYDR